MNIRAILKPACLALALATTACASMIVTDTTPLPKSRLEPLGAEKISHGGYRLESLPVSEDAPDFIVMIAMSGGGKRSASFGYGALKGMRELMVPTRNGPRSLLSQVDYMSGVSGGSFPISYYGLYRDQAFGKFETDFLYDDTNSYIFGTYLLPWHWAWLVQPGIGTNDFMDQAYDRTMFHGATYADLVAKGRPMIAVGATDISYGTPFAFTQESFDLICSDLNALPISRAVAASNGFPGLFSPVTLTNHAKECGGRTPGWVRRIGPKDREDPLSRKGIEALKAERYLDADKTVYLHLSDGGVSDNLAMRTAGNTMLTVTAADVKQRGFLGVRRMLLISIDGQSAQDSTVAQRREVGGLLSMIGLVSGAQIDSYNFETLTTVHSQLKDFAKRLIIARCQQAPMLDGTRCDDVQASLLHISLAGLPESPEKAKLLAIPTGLTLKKDDVDALVQAGHDAVLNSADLRAFIANYPQKGTPEAPAAGTPEAAPSF
jgi:NTE family protein